MGKSSSIKQNKKTKSSSKQNEKKKRFKVMPDSNTISTISSLQENQQIMNGCYFTQRACLLLMTTGKQSI